MRSEEAVREAIDRYADMVKRICFIHLKNEADTEDIFQTVFLKYAMSEVEFASREHEKGLAYPSDDQRLQGSPEELPSPPHCAP